MTRRIGVVAAAVLAVLAWGELSTWRASRQDVRMRVADPSRDVVVVLGFTPDRTGAANGVQQWRVRIALRSSDVTSRFIFSGASPLWGGPSEAAMMADYAISLGLSRDRIVLEEKALSTWQNVEFCIPLMADAATIYFASNTFHARKARRYLREQSPTLAARLRRGADYRFRELILLKPLLALIGT